MQDSNVISEQLPVVSDEPTCDMFKVPHQELRCLRPEKTPGLAIAREVCLEMFGRIPDEMDEDRGVRPNKQAAYDMVPGDTALPTTITGRRGFLHQRGEDC